MDYIQEDPYASHRFQPHDFAGDGGGGGGYHDNYPTNTSYDGHSEQSYQNDWNRMPNGGPYSDANGGDGGNYGYAPQEYPQDWNNRSSPQPHRSLSPQDYHHHPVSDHPNSYRDGDVEPSPYHNLPPHEDDKFRNASPHLFQDVDEQDRYYPQELAPPQPGSYHSHAPDTSLHAGYGDRDESYAGEPVYDGNSNPPYTSGGFNDDGQYPDEQGNYERGPPLSNDYSFHGELQDPVGPGHGAGDPGFDPNGLYDPNRAGDPRFLNQSPYLEDDRYPQAEDYQDVHNRSTGPIEEPINNTYNPQQQVAPSVPHDNSFREPYAQPPQNYDPYDPDRFSDRGPHSRQSYDQGYTDQPPPQQHPNESFHDAPGDYHRYDGLPAVQSDPFADDPFQNRQPPLQGEDPYFRGSSPSGGPDPGGPYDGQPYNEQGQAYPVQFEDGDPRFQGQPYPGDMPDQYGHGAPVYPEDAGSNYGPPQGPGYRENPYYPEDDAAQRLDQLNLNAPPPMDGRHSPSIDRRGHSPSIFGGARDPDLYEVIDFLKTGDDKIKASAAAYLQHITYMDDKVKAEARLIGAIPILIRLLNNNSVEVHKNACGALRNLSYGRNNNDNKRAIKNENGIPELIRRLRNTDQDDVKESVTNVLWNMSSCEDLKQSIIEDGLSVLVNVVILNYAAYKAIPDPWTTVLRNTTGILRNVSSAGFDARKRLRECRGFIGSLIYILKLAVADPESHDIDNKPVENIVCIIRNLSYRIQEVVDPDFYKKRTLPRQQSQTGSGKSKGGDKPGCFGGKSSKSKNGQGKSGSQLANPPPQLPQSSVEYRALWGSEIHTLYSTFLRNCRNPIIMEATAGAIQNLTACDWHPAVESREMVRKEKGLPLLVDLLSAESERVVCATATALRNLAFDNKNKELIGKYAIHQLVNRLPRDNRSTLQDDTICAVIATLFEVIKDNQDFALALVQEGAIPRLMHINRSENRYLQRTLKFTLTLLKALYGFKSLHSEYNSRNFVMQDFTTSNAVARSERSQPPVSGQTPSSSNHTTPYNTLSRPMSGQGRDDNTLTPAKVQQFHMGGYNNSDLRGAPPAYDIHEKNRSNMSLQDNRDHMNYSRDKIPVDIPMNDMGPGYAPLDEPRPHPAKPPVGGVPLFPTLSPADHPVNSPYHGGNDPQNGNEPLYAQVNKGSRRRLDPYADSKDLRGVSPNPGSGATDGGGGADSWV